MWPDMIPIQCRDCGVMVAILWHEGGNEVDARPVRLVRGTVCRNCGHVMGTPRADDPRGNSFPLADRVVPWQLKAPWAARRGAVEHSRCLKCGCLAPSAGMRDGKCPKCRRFP